MHLALLAVSLCGFGQQARPSQLETLLANAQTAQSAGNLAEATADYKRAISMEPAVPQLWANLGLMQHQQGNYSEAIASFLHANHLDPSLYVPNLFLGIDYAHTGKQQAAVPYLVAAERLNKSDPQAPLALGRLYVRSGNLSAAVVELDRATNVDPKLAATWFALGIAHLEQVEKDARDISEHGRESPFAGALYAASLQKQGRFGEAASLYRSLLESHPQPRCLRSELGLSLFRNHDEAGAKEAFANEIVEHPECSLAMLGEARLAIEDGDGHQAGALLENLWSRDHGFVESNANLLMGGVSGTKTPAIVEFLESSEGGIISPDLRGALLNSLGLSDSGSSHSRDATISVAESRHSSNDRTPEAAYQAGHFQECTRQLEPGLARMTSAQLSLLAACAHLTGNERLVARAAVAMRKLDAQSVEALYWSVQANEKLALDSLARFQTLDSNSAESHVLLGDIYHQLERHDEAQAEYQKALSIAPGNPAAMLGLASAYLSNNNIQGAQEIAQSALARSPEDPELNLIMAEVELSQNAFAEAEPYLEKALHAKPQMIPRVHALLGKAYAETGRTNEAIEQLNMGASSDEDGSIQYLLARLYRKQGNTKEASEALDRMKVIKQQRLQRVKRVEDPDLSSLEFPPGGSSTP